LVEKINTLLLCTGDNGYHDHDKIGKQLKQNLSVANLNVSLSTDFKMLLPEKITNFDVVVLYTVDAKTSEDKIISLINSVKGIHPNYKGKPIGFVGIHGATTSFKDNDQYKEMIGASFITHPDFGPIYDFIIKNKKHYITKNLSNFKLQDELYFFKIHSSFNILISCINENIERPVAWYKKYGKGRVFYFSLGHDIDQINNINFNKILINGIEWASFNDHNFR
jgi:type 1 glutamine amidotransferase